MTHWKLEFSVNASETGNAKDSPLRIKVLNQPSPSNVQYIHVVV